MARILVVDDDPGVRRTIELRLEKAGHVVKTAESGERGLALAVESRFDVVLVDMKMPGMSGIEVLTRLRARRVDSALVIMTAFGSVETAVQAMKLGAVDYLQKPFFRDELIIRVKAAAERRQLERQVELLQRHVARPESVGGIIGSSPQVARVRELLLRAAAASGTVLITGETGTGKELVARAIHAESVRATRPFVPVNCAALTETVLESELFGHARGAFTGATDPRAGLVEHAHGGTLFLDEIGIMPHTVQAKLLRVLEAGEIRRLGENEHRSVDVRFVAATNTDLATAVQAGEFREDLFYRLNVLRLHLPPLRERGDDVLALIDHFVERFGREVGVTGLDQDARVVLARFDYPGNIRQLQHIVQQAVAVASGATITLADLPEEILEIREGPSTKITDARQQAERDLLVAVLARHAGDLPSTARELGVSRTTLWRMMRRHRVEWPRPPGALAAAR